MALNETSVERARRGAAVVPLVVGLLVFVGCGQMKQGARAEGTTPTASIGTATALALNSPRSITTTAPNRPVTSSRLRTPTSPPTPLPTPTPGPPLFPTAATGQLGYLQPGSDPSVLPGPILIADRLNNRLLVVNPDGQILWEFPRPGDLRPGQVFVGPDDAFFTPDGRQIIVTHELNATVSVIDVATRRIVWSYGVPYVPGTTLTHLHHPDDSMMLRNADVVIADDANCRILLIGPGQPKPLRVFGRTGSCAHDPPARFGSPNGMFPTLDGNYLATEINGSWVDKLSLAGQVIFSVHPPGVGYPSDTNEVSPGRYLTVDWSFPGKVVEFDDQGNPLWVYAPRGATALNHPSLALPLPNGDVILNDDWNHRIIVVDPKTNRIVWQYGHYGVAGSAPGYLDIPDGMDLLPPYSLASRFAPHEGVLPPTATPTKTTTPAPPTPTG